jgi:hypothetical protein
MYLITLCSRAINCCKNYERKQQKRKSGRMNVMINQGLINAVGFQVLAAVGF